MTGGHTTLPKRTTTLPLVLPAPPDDIPLYRWLYEELRAAMLDGRLKPRTRLPATRDLADQYNLSRNTVLLAYDWLLSEGFVEGKVGAGTYVRALEPGEVSGANLRPEPAPARTPPRLSELARRVTPFPSNFGTTTRAFRANQPALDAFPSALWGRVESHRLRQGVRELLGGGEILGLRSLREAIAEYLIGMRGVRCTADQVIVVSGVQEALDLTIRALLDPGDPVWMEDPGYPGATYLFQATGMRVLAAPVDERGLDVERSRRELEPPRLVYVTPAHQFPFGVSMDAERRLALLRQVEEQGAFIFEDDYDSEYRYVGRPLSALQGLDRNGSVIFCGTFSKVLFPSLRLAYLVVPEALVDAFGAVKSITSREAPGVVQAVLRDFMEQGHFGRHIRKMRDLYEQRLGVFKEGMERKLGGLVTLGPTDAGLQTVGWLPPGIGGEAAASACASQGIEVLPVDRYALEWTGPSAGLVLGFAAVDEREIGRGIDGLARVLSKKGRAVP